jgi:hypothetical protein
VKGVSSCLLRLIDHDDGIVVVASVGIDAALLVEDVQQGSV